MTIRKLKSEVTSKLQSGLTIADATQCVLELVENSLDAKATAVAVRIDFNKFVLEVVDNGCGISHDDLKLAGKRYMTSKCHTGNDLNKTLLTYGYRGQALASIADISGKLSIKTKCKSSKKTMVKIFKNGKSCSVFVSNKERSDCGTTVTVHDFMSAMPVRRKRISEVFDLQDMKNQLGYLAFIHNEVCFTLRDESKGEILLQTHRKKNIGLSFAELYGLALGRFLVPFDYKNEFLRVHGYVSLRRHSERNLQFFYVNKRIVFKSVVEKLVNRLIDKYFKENDGLLNETPVLQAINLNIPAESHNIYVLQIHCPYTYYEMFRNLRKTTVEFRNWDTVLRSIKHAVTSALKFKSSDTDSEKFVKKKLYHRPYVPKKVIVESAIKNGVKGGLVRRKLNLEKNDKGHERSRDENSLIRLNSFLVNPMEVNSGRSTSPGVDEAPKLIPERTTGKSFPEILKVSEASDVIRSAGTDVLKSKMSVDLLSDFIVWFRSKLEHDFNPLKIYEDFMEYERNSRKRKHNGSVKEAKRMKISERRGAEETEEEIRELPSVSNVRDSTTLKHALKITDEKLETRSEAVENRLVEVEKHKRSEKRIKNGNGRRGFGKGSHSIKTCLDLRSEGETFSFSGNLATASPVTDETRSENWFSHGNRMKLGSEHLKGAPAKEELKTMKKKVSGRICEQEKEQKSLPSTGKEPDWSHDDADTQTGFVFDAEADSERSKSVVKAPKEEGSGYFVKRGSVGNKEEGYESRGSQIDGEEVSGSLPIPQPRPPEDTNDKLIAPKETDEKEIKIELDKDQVITEQLSKMTIVKSASDSQDSEATPCAPDGINLEHGNELKLIINDASNDLSSGADGEKFVAKEGKQNDFVFNLTERYDFMPKGLSPYALGKTPANCYKTGSESARHPGGEDGTRSGSKSLLPSNIIEELREETEKNMIYYEKELVKATLVKSGSEFLDSFVVDKEMLSNVTIIGQWDRKFIIAKMDVVSSSELKLLVAFDQHAVDERIRLETLLREFRSSDGKFVSTPCNPPVKCSVKESVGRIIPAVESLLIDYGIKVSVRDHQTVLFNEIPACLEDINCSEKTVALAGKLLEELVEEIRETRGTTASVIPKVLYDFMSAKACKGAVQFNDDLSFTEMEKMIKDLVLCQSPFQCAHGRPSFIPVLDLNAFRKTQLSRDGVKLNFKKFSKTARGGSSAIAGNI